MLYPITSHYRLIAFIGESFGEKYKKPKISIELSHENREHIKDKFRYKFTLITAHDDGEVFRQYTEKVFCSFEKSLEIFDEIFEKLKTVTK